MVAIKIEIENESLDGADVPEILDSLASAIRQNELEELMDGSYKVDTAHGKVWLHILD
jgi:hypothetical protein